MTTQTMWIIFASVVAIMLILDLGVFHRKTHEVKIREALTWTAVWIALAIAFGVFIYFTRGRIPASEYLTAYVIEESLSIDNLFVFLMIFSHFRIPKKYQHRILFWGIVGVLVLRAAFIGLGVTLIAKFSWMMYIFGAFLIYTGIKLAFKKEEDEIDLEKNIILRLSRRFIRITNNFAGGRFFVKENGKWHATLLFIVLLIVETTDVIFAIDSVPAAVGAVPSNDTFLIYTSNVFAVMGLRSLYFALAGIMSLFHFLNYGLCVILTFVGAKMLLHHYVVIPSTASLGVIISVLTISIVASLMWPKKHEVKHAPHEILPDETP